uniref:Uncharacterized protein n=1 Tax=Oreochromis niloticus TaxID=8128 RepID=A0A669BNN1_ORENI
MYYKLTGFTQKLMVSAPVSLTMILLLQWCKKPQDANWVPDFQKLFQKILPQHLHVTAAVSATHLYF